MGLHLDINERALACQCVYQSLIAAIFRVTGPKDVPTNVVLRNGDSDIFRLPQSTGRNRH
jgi:hypothetical protein